MEVRQMATAFLFFNEDILMMKKSSSRITDVEFWSGLGGHMEPEELNFPKKACMREIYEESGFEENDLENLDLKYILMRVKEDEIRQQFVYFGKLKRTTFVSSDEGELHWISQGMIKNLRLSKVVSFMLEHYFENPNLDHVMIGTITVDRDEEPQIQWSELKDPKVF
ncbi:NUDIX domain-containing protein [Paenibacillus sp. Marseille-Q4541]|uniref:NUDIX domain-containing protein n=1 Tax=Paenibacillus sp. Marseille-Q4541 TaxID=2831522 RepID=UPI001BAAEE0E|nr:NUDIX domain-containing protein [Paenibacillus sp. Marseille-Q4541]